MENLMFSLNMILPIFMLIVLGFVFKNMKILSKEFSDCATNLVFYCALPCSLFNSVRNTDVRSVFNTKFLIYLILSQLIIFALCWIVAALFMKDKTQISAVVHGSFRGNFAYIGMPLIANIIGNEILTASVMVMAFGVTLYNVLAVIVLSHYDTSGKKISVLNQIKKIITNPLIISIMLGLLASYVRINFPTYIDKTISYCAQLATPLALILIGTTIRFDTFKSKMSGIILATIMKLIIIPLGVTISAILFGFKGEELVTLFIYNAVPSATNSYIMTKNMNGDGELGAGIVMATSLFSVITLTIFIYILKTMGYLG